MDFAFSIIMFCFSGAILLYALLLALTKDMTMLQRRYRVSADIKDKKAYALMLAKIIAFVGISPLLAAIVGLISPAAGAAVFVISLILLIWLGVRLFYREL